MREIGRLCLLVATLGSPAAAHEFWLQPHPPVPAPGERVGIDLRVGDDRVGDALPRDPRHVHRFVAIGPGGIEAVGGVPGRVPAGSWMPADAGTYVVAYWSTSRRVEQAPAAFERYLGEKGLDAALAERHRRGEQDRPGRERFARCAKAIVVTADGPTPGYDRPLGMSLELVPETHPLAGATAAMVVRLLRRGRPLPNALVYGTRLDGPSTPVSARTDADGRVRFGLSGDGTWRLGAVHMERLDGDPHAEWRSWWASLTFLRE